MPKHKKTDKHRSPAEAAPAFEESLDELQQIVAELDDGSLGLEESMQRFEKGISLLRHCYEVLEQAEQRIEILTGTDSQGNPLTAPFDAAATFATPQRSAGAKAGRQPAESETSEEPVSADDDLDEDPNDDADHTLF